MSKLKKYSKYFLIAFIMLFIFKGFLYRNFVIYEEVETRKNYIISNKKIIQYIEKHLTDKELTIEDIMAISMKITVEKLHFTTLDFSNNPNINFETKKANCVGYASLYNAIGNYILKEQKMSDTYEFRHLVGKMEFLGFDMHGIFQSPFFKDHDYNQIINKKTGEKQSVDPSLYDYTWIDRVTSK